MTANLDNHAVYSTGHVVRFYASASRLQPAEETILSMFAERLRGARILDLGVGGGRTIGHLSRGAARYVGADYSPAMIAASRRRFADPKIELVVEDARKLSFADASFDFVLFSYNGIDYVDHEGRLRVLEEVRRVLVKDGVFAFSTHNLGRTDLEFVDPPGEPTWRKLLRLRWRARMRKHNPGFEKLATSPFAVVNDGSYGFRAGTYHIREDAQIAQLDAAGFGGVTVFSGTKGHVLEEARDEAHADPWLYFTCRSC